MRLRGLRTLAQMDAVLYVHGGPKDQSPKGLDPQRMGAVPRPIAFLRESVRTLAGDHGLSQRPRCRPFFFCALGWSLWPITD